MEIALAAAALFAERGAHATTAEAIADRAEISLRTFYRYFRIKQDSVAPLLAFGAQRWQNLLAAVPYEVPLPDALAQAAEEAMTEEGEVAAESFEWTRGLLRAAEDDPALRTVWASVNQESERQLAPLLAERTGAHAGDLEIRLTAAAATAAIRVALETWATGDPEADREAAAELAVSSMRTLTAPFRH
nr:TetR family transcriptional regulator [Streptomyces sp. HNM0574]